MKVPLQWFREYLDTEADVQELADRLTEIGHEVESVETVNGDQVLDVSLTPNRGDCASIRGLARDLAATGIGNFRDRDMERSISDIGGYPYGIKVDHGLDDCRAIAAVLVTNVKNSGSIPHIADRIRTAGMNEISPLVDVTNYVALDIGRPLHVFDADKVVGDLHVRRARKGEKCLALNGIEYELDENVCVISDDIGIESIAGCIGGMRTACTLDTENVIVEAAVWDPASVSRTGQKLGIVTEARYRYERGIDAEMMIPGLNYAVNLIQEFCGGDASDVLALHTVSADDRIFDFNLFDFLTTCGLPLVSADKSVDEVEKEFEQIFSSLGFEKVGVTREPPMLYTMQWSMQLKVPSWRNDITCSASLITEIVRIKGFSEVPEGPLPFLIQSEARTSDEIDFRNQDRIRNCMAMLGMQEAVTYSFIPDDMARRFSNASIDMDALKLKNPISPKLSVMRPSLIPGLLLAGDENYKHGRHDAALFEIGTVFLTGEPGQQKLMACGLRQNTASVTGSGRHWNGYAEPVTIFDAKSDMLSVLDMMGYVIGETVRPESDDCPWYHPEQAGRVSYRASESSPSMSGLFGSLHPEILKSMGINYPVVCFELELLHWPDGSESVQDDSELSDLQPVRRDFSFVVHKPVLAGDIVSAIMAMSDSMPISDVNVFDVYDRDDDEKAIGVEVVLQPVKETMTDDEISGICDRIAEAVHEKTGGRLDS